ncbi:MULTISPECIES: MerR family transcriptional regulator [Priestia]|jgi:MerR family transcriptional regulator, repressor of the yfmOP operon|uniref:MerR family transcriptional regulator n=1 Tax=Priestia flexa TaxID=86664 RepID=A0A8I1MFA0_9BACI|nr:MerR family transcriptional regulator [Priestia flexa]AQX54921.1 MerR family transcriptional regulator [Priestia flexa]MBN8251350.1 MerR family transcriptional regulator [Priestia flexa]MBN8434387.1 MerR family transcriptional regulator [Priestia flexa]MCA0966829.1 MerR family transcriptional regulator [Priestia flexa]MCA1202658.1 MerR family transcriptional regulator [Priestia flexa]
MYKIDEVTKMTGLTKRAVRYYEEIGLILPPSRTKGNVRLYTEDEVSELKKVAEAKEVLGFSLQELQEFMSLKRTIEQAKRDQDVSAQDVLEIENMIHTQMEMIMYKVDKMMTFKEELEAMHKRATDIRKRKEQEE